MIRNSPSKRVFVVAFVAIGILVWALWHTNSLYTEKLLAEKSPLEALSSPELALIPDSDKDGLPDWIENLLRTDPFSADSDGDGILDGKQHTSLKRVAYIEISDSPLNYLTSLGNSIANQDSGSVNLPSAQLRQFPDHYTEDGVSKVKTTANTATVYVNGVLESVSLNPTVIEEEPLAIIQHWIETNDERDLEQLEILKMALMKTSDRIAALEVPVKFVGTHLDLINSMYLEAQALSDIEITTFNPVQGFLAAAQYANYRSKRSQAIIDLTDHYFGIVPPPDNPIN